MRRAYGRPSIHVPRLHHRYLPTYIKCSTGQVLLLHCTMPLWTQHKAWHVHYLCPYPPWPSHCSMCDDSAFAGSCVPAAAAAAAAAGAVLTDEGDGDETPAQLPSSADKVAEEMAPYENYIMGERGGAEAAVRLPGTATAVPKNHVWAHIIMVARGFLMAFLLIFSSSG